MGMNVLVVGEICRDVTYYCKVSRISPEAPVPVADLVWKSTAEGMAGNVNCNLVALGVNTTFVHQRLTQHIQKTRYVEQKSGQHLLRADNTHPSITPLDVSTIENIDEYDAIVISDYNKGFIEYSTCLLYTSPSPRDRQKSRMPSSA